MKTILRILPWLALLAAAIAFAPILCVNTLQREYVLTLQRYLSQVAPPRYAFAGDSLTEGGDWGRRLSGNPLSTVNLAFGGARIRDITGQVARAALFRPQVVFVTAGSNDILSNRRTLARIREDYQELLSACPENAALVVTLIPYTDDPEANARIAEANVEVRMLSAGRGARIIDLNPHLAPDGVLAPEFSGDGVHLNNAGYRIWTREIRDALEN